MQWLAFRIAPISSWKLHVEQKVIIQFKWDVICMGPGDDLNWTPCKWWVGFCSAGFDLAIIKAYQDFTILCSTGVTWEEAAGTALSAGWTLQVQFDWESFMGFRASYKIPTGAQVCCVVVIICNCTTPLFVLLTLFCNGGGYFWFVVSPSCWGLFMMGVLDRPGR